MLLLFKLPLSHADLTQVFVEGKDNILLKNTISKQDTISRKDRILLYRHFDTLSLISTYLMKIY